MAGSMDDRGDTAPSSAGNDGRPAIVVLFGAGQASAQAIRFARSLTSDIHAIHVRADEKDTLALRRAWDDFDIPLVILPPDRHAIVPPILHYIESVQSQRKAVTVVLAECDKGKLLSTVAQRHAALAIRRSLQADANVTLASVRG